MKLCNVKTLTGDTCRSFVSVDSFGESVCIHGHRPSGFKRTSMDFLERDHSNMNYDITKGFFGNMWQKNKEKPDSTNYGNWIFEIDKGMQILTYQEMLEVLTFGFENCDIRKRWNKKSKADFKLVASGIPVLRKFFEQFIDNDGDIRSKIGNSSSVTKISGGVPHVVVNITPEQIYIDKGISQANRRLIVKYLYENMDEITTEQLKIQESMHRPSHYWFEHKIVNRMLKVYVVSFAKNYVKPTLPDDLVSISWMKKHLKINNQLLFNWASKGEIFSTYVHKQKLKDLEYEGNSNIEEHKYILKGSSNYPRAISYKETIEKFNLYKNSKNISQPSLEEVAI